MNPYDLIGGYHKLTLPTSPIIEIKYPAIKTYESVFFRLNPTQTGVIFKAPSLGGTTSNSSNTRSELRELRADGSLAAWSTSVGVHSMECEFSVDVLPFSPKNKPHVVTGQIHDGGDDVTVFRVEGNVDGLTAKIWIADGNTTHGRLLTDSYKLGAKYRVGFYVSGGIITFTFNGQPVVGYTQIKKKTGCYFKAGCYNQDGGDTAKRPDGEGVYAQVTLCAVQVCHDGVCTGNAPGSGVTVDPPVVPPVTVDPLQPIIDGMQAIIAEAQDAIVKLTGLKL